MPLTLLYLAAQAAPHEAFVLRTVERLLLMVQVRMSIGRYTKWIDVAAL